MKKEKELIAGILKGEDKVIRHLYDTYFPRIAAFVRKNSGQEDDAMDVFQEALMGIYHLAQKPDFELKSAFYTLLYAMARNYWFNQLKKKKLERVTNPTLDLSTENEGIEAALHTRAKYQLFRSKFQELGEGCQKILELFFAGESMRDIAQKLDISEKYARKRKYLCKEKLVQLVQEDVLFMELKT